jgi:prepilin-type N-terminal cleavage/methylation domain-containing protein
MIATRGFSLTETLVVLLLLGTVAAVTAPLAQGIYADTRIRSAGRETSLAFWRARLEAIRTHRETAVRVERRDGRYQLIVYGDGNGNGVRNREIDAGIDPRSKGGWTWDRSDVTVGILQNVRVPDPSDPSRRLSRTEDPVRFNNSNLCSFSPISESTPGSLYLTDGKTKMAVVRVLNRTGRIRVLYFTAGEPRWRP